ncbi:MAG: LytTR family DNA-binding domain-containing protein [Saprospiraceae bacterium]|jgi:two-component system LytT family response regulator
MNVIKNPDHLSSAIIYRQEISIMTAIKNSGKYILPVPGGFKCCLPDDILYIHSESNYSECFFKDGTKLLLSKTLKNIEDQLPNHHFFRVHRSFVINALHIMNVQINTDESYLTLTGNLTIPISREKRKLFSVGTL